MTIFKFSLPVHGLNTVLMPKWADIVHCDFSGDDPAIWVYCNQEALKEERQFLVLGTGKPIPKKAIYLGTAVKPGVGVHVFEV